ncbi:[Fe-Fe] hydrogenase large subunit C-terminal domain-containing protein [Anaeromicropila populeti]|uniref:Ferredoxin hydrogenase n=1 Tax=Anaeromicropila populeti TaxID=37658 RepID=A0A1I6LJC3_9FIRM|nr:[Fe-Fe] hydrogenase large subunit C-terminal domain-containing protein [Anaeromicropila populeti]SFS03430.1 ferredoxin hydrogenase [Anaeromicropila populeti]
MNHKYKALYAQLVESYYQGDFEGTFSKILEEAEEPEKIKEVLAVLCGVEIDQADTEFNYTQKIIHGLTQNNVRQKIVQKVSSCNTDCEKVDGKSKCQSVCPLDAIVRDLNSNEKWIDDSLCLNCGRCVEVCEKGNYLDTQQFLPLAEILRSKQKVFAIVAPAIAGQFGSEVTLDQLREAFLKLGFTDMVEVALAADILSLKEAIEFNEHVKKEGDFMITSCCCPMWVAALRKVYHEFITEVSPSVSPMIAMARILKSLDQDAKVVFVGPCVAKKAEAKEKDLAGDVDYVLTFQELEIIFESLHINPEKLTGVPTVDYASKGGRMYGRTGGVSSAVWDIVEQIFPEKRELFQAVQVDGMRECKALLDELREGKIKASFIEGMGCKGGCVGGPKAIVDKDTGREAVEKMAVDSAVKIPVHSEVLLNMLKKIGVEDVKDLKHGNEMFERSFQ